MLSPWKDKWKFVFNKAMLEGPVNQAEPDFFLKEPHTLATIVDVEIMKRADFLVGSMTSELYRLGVELNFFHHKDQLKRFYEVRVRLSLKRSNHKRRQGAPGWGREGRRYRATKPRGYLEDNMLTTEFDI